jgi:hypothetical protein
MKGSVSAVVEARNTSMFYQTPLYHLETYETLLIGILRQKRGKSQGERQ